MKYTIGVVRITHSVVRDFEVEAESAEDAQDIAIADAKYADFTDQDFEHSVVSCFEEI